MEPKFPFNYMEPYETLLLEPSTLDTLICALEAYSDRAPHDDDLLRLLTDIRGRADDK